MSTLATQIAERLFEAGWIDELRPSPELVACINEVLRPATHDLCHDKHLAASGPVSVTEFCGGCEAFQKQLYGQSPIAEMRKEREDAYDALADVQEALKGIRPEWTFEGPVYPAVEMAKAARQEIDGLRTLCGESARALRQIKDLANVNEATRQMLVNIGNALNERSRP